MKVKKFISLCLIAVMLMAQFSFIQMMPVAYAVDEEGTNEGETRYFESQLSKKLSKQKNPELYELATKFYKAMQYMDENGIFKKGEDLELVSAGLLTKEEVQKHINDKVLLYSMASARDAFYYDYSDIFYVDFTQLSIRVTASGSNYYCYLGKGRSGLSTLFCTIFIRTLFYIQLVSNNLENHGF